MYVNAVTKLLYLETSYTEQAFIDSNSLKRWVLGSNNNWYPDIADWALSSTTDSSTSADPYWSVDGFQWLMQHNYLPTSTKYGTYQFFYKSF